ncbi:MAG: hypothetical protein LAT64_04590 [Phycisphaerales bacterium]|nr:hypothetical protein [Planctomycetota bacterium]MCH8508031.1 hypothetical protein [Phycisphaerales bacterium]
MRKVTMAAAITLMIAAGSVAAESVALNFGAMRGAGDTLQMRYETIAGGGNAGRVSVGDRNLQAGHIVHTIMSGPRTGSRFSTFCVELGQNIGNGVLTYDIVGLADAPLPGPSYGQAAADAVSAVVANARAMGWIDARLQADTGQENYLGRMGAIQAAIWEAIGGDVQIGSAGTSHFVSDAYSELMDIQTFDASLRMAGLRALVHPSRQDMLYVVPLPPAAFAGLGMLGACFGVRAVRRR